MQIGHWYPGERKGTKFRTYKDLVNILNDLNYTEVNVTRPEFPRLDGFFPEGESEGEGEGGAATEVESEGEGEGGSEGFNNY